jgi:hypothetical protein
MTSTHWHYRAYCLVTIFISSCSFRFRRIGRRCFNVLCRFRQFRMLFGQFVAGLNAVVVFVCGAVQQTRHSLCIEHFFFSSQNPPTPPLPSEATSLQTLVFLRSKMWHLASFPAVSCGNKVLQRCISRIFQPLPSSALSSTTHQPCSSKPRNRKHHPLMQTSGHLPRTAAGLPHQPANKTRTMHPIRCTLPQRRAYYPPQRRAYYPTVTPL